MRGQPRHADDRRTCTTQPQSHIPCQSGAWQVACGWQGSQAVLFCHVDGRPATNKGNSLLSVTLSSQCIVPDSAVCGTKPDQFPAEMGARGWILQRIHRLKVQNSPGCICRVQPDYLYVGVQYTPMKSVFALLTCNCCGPSCPFLACRTPPTPGGRRPAMIHTHVLRLTPGGRGMALAPYEQ